MAKVRIISLVALAALGCTAKGEDAPQAAVVSGSAQAPTPALESEAALTLPLTVPGTGARIVRFELASEVVGREPRGAATRFSRKEVARVFAFLEVSNDGGQPVELGVAFDPMDSDAVSTVLTVDIPSSKRWRTQVFMNTAQPGKYRAVIIAANGDELGGRDFEVVD